MKKMKLELKHVAPYLPYNLMAKFPETNKKGCRSYVTGVIGALYSDGTMVCHDTVNASPNRFMPMLLPLKYFEDINSPAFQDVNCDLTHQIEINEVANKQRNYTSLSVGAFELCLKYHIDIFNLIPQGLAVSI